MRFYVTANHPNHPHRRKPFQLTVGADSVRDIPRAVPGFVITEVRDADGNAIQNWREQMQASEPGSAKEVEATEASSPQRSRHRAAAEK
jgi:hypothetical protein